MDNFKNIIEEVRAFISNTNTQNAEVNKNKKKENHKFEFICVLLKITNNFLIKISEKTIIENIRRDFNNMGIKKLIEIEEENINFDNLLFEIIN